MASVEILINLDETLKYVRQRLGDLQKKAPMVIRTAINKTAKEAKTKDERITKKTYTAKKDINSLQLKKATTANLQAILSDKGANISMTHFNHYIGKSGISVIINNSKGRQLLYKKKDKDGSGGWKNGNNAFFNTLSQGGNGIAVRYGKSRLPIEKMSSISSPVMHGNKNTWGTIEGEMQKKLYDNIEKELERILGT